MVALEVSWQRNIDAIRSITIEIVGAILASAFLTSVLMASCVSFGCTTLTVSELWRINLSVSALPAILFGLIIGSRIRRSVEQIRMTQEELVNLACIDGLTGLLNQPGFNAAAAEAFEEARRSGGPISALVCDIDTLRRLNDRYGHKAGDLALRNFAQVLEETIECRCAILGRQGGDEFAILLPGIDLKEAVMIAESLREVCEARALVQRDPAAKFTISVGVGVEASGASELGCLLRRADAALYRAKRAGGNQIGSGPTMFGRHQSMPKIERSPIRSAKLKAQRQLSSRSQGGIMTTRSPAEYQTEPPGR
jgi:diguanylate cyclase (GGDEF)-like protein